ncbi:MAG TPA: RNA polymerase sigma-70 factor [Prevotella sp.]|nr:RNA polymerase sigma-70 factor [Candidatus Segatella violae]
MDRTEEIIVRQLKEGREKAYKFLYDYHYPVLCHIAEQYVHDTFLAETIVSDTIFHLWEIRTTLTISTSIRSYLAQSVRNRCLNYLHAQVQQRELVLEKGSVTDLPIMRYIQSDDYPLGRLLTDELENEIMDAIDRLPEKCQQVFRLSRFEGKKNQEIAEVLGISVNTVKFHMKNALALLQTDLHKYLLAIFFIFINN